MMRSLFTLLWGCFALLVLVVGCVDPEDLVVRGTVDVVVVDGTITNLSEPQIIRLNRSRADPLTGRFGVLPLTKATVEVVVDSGQVIVFRETDAGRYLAPDGFAGQINHGYQLRLTLNDGTAYQSTIEVMQAVPAIDNVNVQFNPESLLAGQQLKGGYTAAHDVYVSWKDPVGQKNYYRWDWIDWERQEWCRSCNGQLYYVYDVTGKLLEDCRYEQFTYPNYDYNCRTACWEIIYSQDLNLFADSYSDGNSIVNRKIGQVPLYSKEHCLVEIRQSSLTSTAYSFFKKLADQTQNSGGVADAPSSLPVGNLRNSANPQEPVVGYFTASAVTRQQHWLSRSDATGFTPGLFRALNDGRFPVNEQSTARDRPPLAVCVQSDTRTPFKPTGWRD